MGYISRGQDVTLTEQELIEQISALGSPLQHLRVNAAGTGLEYADEATASIDGSGTTDELTYWVDSNTIGALAVATYPSKTEISYVKGVTSAIQTQLNAKQASDAFLDDIADLTDPGANSFLGWDDTAGAMEFLTQAEARTILGLGTAAYVATDLADLNEATIETAIDTLANLTSVQGRTITLSDAGFDVLAGWDDSASAYKNFLLADITAEGTPASGDYFLMYGAEGDLRKVNFDDMPSGGSGVSEALAIAYATVLQ